MTDRLSLKKLTSFSGRKGPLLLVIMDGIAIGKENDYNAVYKAKTPTLNQLKQSPLYRTLKAHGTAVGMPTDEDMGNSEVGHNTIGAGRSVPQGASLVSRAIENGEIFQNKNWQEIVSRCKNNKSTLHFIGLLSNGNVHSHINHLLVMLSKAADQQVERCRIHIMLDGRDVNKQSAPVFIRQLEDHLAKLNREKGTDYKIASGGGRMLITMDRYNADWPMVKRGWETHVHGNAPQFASALDAVNAYYASDPNPNDQYVPPFVIAESGKPVGTIQDGDAVIMFNFRGDRAIEISRAFEENAFDKFDRGRRPDVLFAGMMEYDGDLHIPKRYLVNPPRIQHPVSEYLCAEGVTAFALSETQKYGHVTYFWNGNRSGYIDNNLEKYVEIPSDNLPFDQKPEMKAYEITEKTIELLTSGKYRFGRINFPNGDMVGHTGNMTAAVKSVEVTDECVKKLIDTVKKLGGIAIITSDHGNADEMATVKDGQVTVKTAHTLNPVPFAIVDSDYTGEYKLADVKEAGLANIAATICNLLGYEKPAEYESSLIAF